jgi:signal peptidase I
MSPNLRSNWKIIFKKNHLRNLNRRDIILFNYNDKLIIKRIIGLPSEYVEINDGSVYINDNQLTETYIKTARTSEMISKWQLGENEFVILGDNSNDSLDSRNFGPVFLDEFIYVFSRKIWPIRVKSS